MNSPSDLLSPYDTLDIFGDNFLDQEEPEPDDIIMVHMHMKKPLSYLKTLLEKKVGCSLQNYTIWLQDTQILEPDCCLSDQCVEFDGLVQTNVQVITDYQKINIVDVIKLTESALATLALEESEKATESITMNSIGAEEEIRVESPKKPATPPPPSAPEPNPNFSWKEDTKFKKEQSRLKIPDNPKEWNKSQVSHWLHWAIKQFGMTSIRLSDWSITGEELCKMEYSDFQEKIPYDPGDIFWTHIDILRKNKTVSVNFKNTEVNKTNTQNNSSKSNSVFGTSEAKEKEKPHVVKKHVFTPYPSKPPTALYSSPSSSQPTSSSAAIQMANANGQVQLWQFLLDILTDYEYCDIIKWVTPDGEFKLINPEKVAKIWGERKNKPTMNYEKLSRALRYYYDGDLLSKVSGKRFAYKFDCDLQSLIGYSAGELAKMVLEQYNAVHKTKLNTSLQDDISQLLSYDNNFDSD